MACHVPLSACVASLCHALCLRIATKVRNATLDTIRGFSRLINRHFCHHRGRDKLLPRLTWAAFWLIFLRYHSFPAQLLSFYC